MTSPLEGILGGLGGKLGDSGALGGVVAQVAQQLGVSNDQAEVDEALGPPAAQ